MRRKVVITGVGVVTPLGAGIDTLMTALMKGERSFTNFDSSSLTKCPVRLIALTDDPAPPQQSNFGTKGHAERILHAAVDEALLNAGVSRIGQRTGVVIGTGLGGIEGVEEVVFHGNNPFRNDPVNGFSAHLGQSIARRLEIQGTVSVVSTGCSSGNYALMRATELIEAGRENMVIVGGTDPRSLIVLSCFNRLGALDPEGIKPFDQDRQGTTLGEGSAALIVEDLSTALARGATPLAEVLGIGSSCDAYNPTAPEPSGRQILLAMQRALHEAGVNTTDISAVLAHGTGTRSNDSVEGSCILRFFQECAIQPAVTAIKGMIGHSGGGANMITLAAAVKCLSMKKIFPTIGTRKISSDCLVNLVMKNPAPIQNGPILINSLAFGGNNSIIVLGDYRTVSDCRR